MRRIIKRTVTTTITTTWQITWDDGDPPALAAAAANRTKEKRTALDDGAPILKDRQNNKETNNAISVPSDIPADRASN